MRPAFSDYTPEELDSRIAEIFAGIEAAGKAPTMTELAIRLGVSDETLLRYKSHVPNPDEPSEYDAHCWCIKKATQHCAGWLQQAVLTGKQPVGAMFVLKCAHGWIEEDKRRGVQLGGSGDPIQIEVRLVGSSDQLGVDLGVTAPKPKRKPAKPKAKRA